jgi:aspartyl/asparaginyl-tRNA synthetase
MFEFELKGGIKELAAFETELLEYLGFGKRASFQYKKYDELKDYYKTNELSHKHEKQMQDDFAPILFCQEFPVYTSPFWNMKKKNDEYANKIDVIMYGHETIGSAERSISPREMAEAFYTISDGKYAQKLFELFGAERVENELKEFLRLTFVERCGGGIGMTRLISADKMRRLLAPAAG